MKKSDLNFVELASEGAMCFIDNLAAQMGVTHSVYDKSEQTYKFKEDWQIKFDEVYNLLYGYIENELEL